MKLKSIELNNWQPFLGRGFDSTLFQFSSDTGQKNMIIYGENTHGKTAIWQAVQFALYGKVNKRKTGWQDGKFKPYIGKSTSEEPLLNQTAKDNGDFSFGVKLEFSHNGDDFTLDRYVSERKGVKIARKNSDMEPQPLFIKNETKGDRIQHPQQFINEILPFDLAQFFMFDGERLDEYRKLFEDTNDVELKGYIEAILRFPVLTDGVEDFKDIKKKSEKLVRKYDLSSNADKELAKKIEDMTKHLEETEYVKGQLEDEKEQHTSKLLIVEKFLSENDKGKEALVQQKIFEKQEEDLENEIEKIQNRLSKELPGKWKTLLSSRIDNRLLEFESELARQKDETEQIGKLKDVIDALDRRLNGDPCVTCGHIHNLPSLEEKDEISADIVSHQEKLEELEESSITPDPAILWDKRRALEAMKSSNTLDTLIDHEKDIVEKKQAIRATRKNLKKALKLLEPEMRKEVAKYLAEQIELLKSIGACDEQITQYKNYIDDMEKAIKIESEKIQPQSETVAHKKAKRKVTILDALIRVWEDATDSHREHMRAIVEKNASEMFMSLTNKKKTYSGLRIHSDFQVEILHKKKKRGAEAGSGGQSALMAYSILDSLTRSSGIEFPMIVDTPARSIDSKNLERLFDYLLIESGKQVIILPESKELSPDIGDDRYGHTCAATYSLELIGEEEDLTIRHIRVNNTGKPTEEFSNE